jgi:hypothetical protein
VLKEEAHQLLEAQSSVLTGSLYGTEYFSNGCSWDVLGESTFKTSVPKYLRATAHYGCPSREAVGLNDQPLLTVQRNGPIKIQELEPLAGHSGKPPKAKGRRSIPL